MTQLLSNAKLRDQALKAIKQLGVSNGRRLGAMSDPSTLRRLRELSRIVARSSEQNPRVDSDLNGELTVFLSHDSAFRVNDGSENVFEAAQRIFKSRPGYSIRTGDDGEPENDDVRKDAFLKIAKSDVFVAVVTPDNKPKTGDDEAASKDNPSPWITLELGAAYALDKPISILSSTDVAVGYFQRIIPSVYRLENKDLDNSFDEKFLEAVDLAWDFFALKVRGQT